MSISTEHPKYDSDLPDEPPPVTAELLQLEDVVSWDVTRIWDCLRAYSEYLAVNPGPAKGRAMDIYNEVINKILEDDSENRTLIITDDNRKVVNITAPLNNQTEIPIPDIFGAVGWVLSQFAALKDREVSRPANYDWWRHYLNLLGVYAVFAFRINEQHQSYLRSAIEATDIPKTLPKVLHIMWTGSGSILNMATSDVDESEVAVPPPVVPYVHAAGSSAPGPTGSAQKRELIEMKGNALLAEVERRKDLNIDFVALVSQVQSHFRIEALGSRAPIMYEWGSCAETLPVLSFLPALGAEPCYGMAIKPTVKRFLSSQGGHNLEELLQMNYKEPCASCCTLLSVLRVKYMDLRVLRRQNGAFCLQHRPIKSSAWYEYIMDRISSLSPTTEEGREQREWRDRILLPGAAHGSSNAVQYPGMTTQHEDEQPTVAQDSGSLPFGLYSACSASQDQGFDMKQATLDAYTGSIALSTAVLASGPLQSTQPPTTQIQGPIDPFFPFAQAPDSSASTPNLLPQAGPSSQV